MTFLDMMCPNPRSVAATLFFSIPFSAALAAQMQGAVTRIDESLHEPALVLADGKPIDVTTGHAAPYVMDWDGDGTRDLLVGEFGNGRFDNAELPEGIGKGWIEKGRFSNGRVRIYKNHGSDDNPRYEDFTYLQAGGGDATVPIT